MPAQRHAGNAPQMKTGCEVDHMKKLLSLLLIAVLTFSCLCACGAGAARDETGKKKRIVATIFPEYDWIRNILGDRLNEFDLELLLDSGVDMHSFQPTADDMISISSCDLFVYNGGESDRWVDDALKNGVNRQRITLDLMETLKDLALEEETVEGMQADAEEEAEGPAADEHIWLSLKNAAAAVKEIRDRIITLDPDNQDVYTKNAADYLEKISQLDRDYTEMTASAGRRTVLFCDRFPFRYLAEDYDLTYYAAFQGCSAETEASFATVSFLANKLSEESLPAVITLDGRDTGIADTVIQTSGRSDIRILKMDSMQSVTRQAVDAGADYLAIMRENLQALSQALNL